VTNDTAYYYVVSGTNPAGTSALTNEASAVPKDVPSQPTNLSAVIDQAGRVQLSWSAPSYYNQFNVKHGIIGGGETTLTTVSGTNYVHLSPSITYLNYYVVTATWGSMESPPSNEVVAAKYTTPSLNANAGDATIVLTWNGVVNAVDYDLKRSLT